MKSNSDPYSIQFDIDGLPKTTNKSSQNAHWSQFRKESKNWKKIVWVNCLQNGLPSSPVVKAKLRLVRHSAIRPDADGLVSTFKHVIDGLVTSKVLQNDKFENIGMPEYLWEKAPKGKGKISVYLEEIK